MTTHRYAFTLLSAAWLVGGCDQPRPHCSVAPGDFAARYEKIEDLQGNCEGMIGGKLSLQPYYEPRSKKDLSPDFTSPRIALIPGVIWDIRNHAATRGATPNAEDDPVAYGSFTTRKAGDDDYCQIPEMSTARVRVPAIPEATDECSTQPAEPAVDEQYRFTNVRVYNSPGAYGTQLSADLTYTNATCSARYRVTAVYPFIECGAPPPDQDGGSEDDAGIGDGTMDGGMNIDAALDDDAATDTDGGELPQVEEPTEPDCPEEEGGDTGPLVPDDGACQGTGISPEFTASCDPTLLLCLLPQTITK